MKDIHYKFAQLQMHYFETAWPLGSNDTVSEACFRGEQITLPILYMTIHTCNMYHYHNLNMVFLFSFKYLDNISLNIYTLLIIITPLVYIINEIQ